jgi:hypothetical protein
MLLIFGEYVHAKAIGARKYRAAFSVVGEADEDQWRLERYRGKGIGSKSARLAFIVNCRRNGNAGRMNGRPSQ